MVVLDSPCGSDSIICSVVPGYVILIVLSEPASINTPVLPLTNYVPWSGYSDDPNPGLFVEIIKPMLAVGGGQ